MGVEEAVLMPELLGGLEGALGGEALGAAGFGGALEGSAMGASAFDAAASGFEGSQNFLAPTGETGYQVASPGGPLSSSINASKGSGSWVDYMAEQAAAPVTDMSPTTPWGDVTPNAGNVTASMTGSGAFGNVVGNIGTGDFLKTGLNYLFNQNAASRAQKMMESIMKKGSALDQPQRVPYQDMALDLMRNPAGYLQNNPFAVSVADRFKNNIIPANVAKSGNPSKVLDETGSAFANAISGNYNELAGLLQGYGGFNQGAGYGATAGASLAPGIIGNQKEAYAAFGDLLKKGFPSSPTGNSGGQSQTPGGVTIKWM